VKHRANDAEFISLYAKCQSDLFRYVATLVPHLQDAEDVLSEVTVALWEKFGDFERGASFLAWARRFAYLRVLKYYRARDRRFVLPQRLLQKLAAEIRLREEPTDPRLIYLAECKNELSIQDRQLLDERYVDRQRVQDLAMRLSQSANSVSKSLARIRRMLLECIERRIADHEYHVGEGHG
jgi:RNA polymerase sigma-70 factor, ECF subfamily